MKRTTRNRLVLVTALSLAAQIATVAGSGSAYAAAGDPVAAPAWSPDVSYAPSPGDVAARAVDEAISTEEAERRFRVERAAAGLEMEAAARWPETFAGVWMDRADFGVRVAFTKDAARNVADLAEAFPYAEELEASDAKISWGALASTKQKLGASRDALQRGEAPSAVPPSLRATKGTYDLDVDLVSGAVVVRVADASAALRSEIAKTYGSHVRVETGLAEPTTCSIYNCTYAMLGGIELQVGSTNLCSSAFSAFSGSARYVLSAAHCYVLTGQTARSNASAYYGYTEAYSYSGPVDAERIRRSSSWQESGKFFVEGENPRYVNFYMPYSGIVVNSYIGKTGRTTGTTRGYVLSKTVSPSYVSGSYNFISADFCVDGGDSGGAVWESTTAYGIISGKFTSGFCRPAPGRTQGTAGPGIFGSVETAFTTLGVSLIGALNLPPNATYTYSCSVLLACSFNGSGSDDDDGSITSYSWSFGDGTFGSGAFPSHTYLLPGNYIVTLTVFDNNGASDSYSQTILVI